MTHSGPRSGRSGRLRILVVGLGPMGLSHAKAYARFEGFEVVGLCTRMRRLPSDLPASLAPLPHFDDYAIALVHGR